MSCNDKDGGTHHFACDCREQWVRELQELLKKLQAENDKLRKDLAESVKGVEN